MREEKSHRARCWIPDSFLETIRLLACKIWPNNIQNQDTGLEAARTVDLFLNSFSEKQMRERERAVQIRGRKRVNQ
jgi:hypothetical protein